MIHPSTLGAEIEWNLHDAQEKSQLDAAACKTLLGELYFVGGGVPRNLTKAGDESI